MMAHKAETAVQGWSVDPVNVLYSCSLEEEVISKGHVTTANTKAHARTHTVLGLMRTSSRLVTFLLF